jgi:hypothetical protein
VKTHLVPAESRKLTTYIGGYGKKRVLLINDSGMLKLILCGHSPKAEGVREKARRTPGHLRTAHWPVGLSMDAA